MSPHGTWARTEAELMCLAVPAQVVECDADEALVDLQGNTLRVSTVLTPEVSAGDWVLVHAGFAITQLDEAEARETWDYLRLALGDSPDEAESHQKPNQAEDNAS